MPDDIVNLTFDDFFTGQSAVFINPGRGNYSGTIQVDYTTHTASGLVSVSNVVGFGFGPFGSYGMTFQSDGAGNYTITSSDRPPGSLAANTFTFSYTGERPTTDTATYSQRFSGTSYSTALNPVGQQQQPVTATVPLAAPVIQFPMNGADINNNQPTIGGTGEANDLVSVYINGALAGTTPTDVSGRWRFTPTHALADGSYTVYATESDGAGSTSGRSDSDTFTIDTQPPPAPLVLAPSNGADLNNARPTIRGTGEANALATIYINGNSAGTASTDGAGDWSFIPTTALPDGSYTVKATETDAAGNISGFSNVDTFTVDTTPPGAPVLLTPLNGAHLNTNRPTISGTGDANDVATIYINGNPAGTATIDTAGHWSFTPGAALLDAAYTVEVTETDAAGNTSGFSNLDTFTIDTMPLGSNALTLWELGYYEKLHHGAMPTVSASPTSAFDVSLSDAATAPWHSEIPGLGLDVSISSPMSEPATKLGFLTGDILGNVHSVT